MYKQSNISDYKKVLDKIQQKTLVYGDKTLMAEFTPMNRPVIS
jgi:hypothetical protein